MTRIFAHADYDFIGFRYKAIISTIVIFCVGVVALLAWGIAYSIEFNGGTLILVKTDAPINVVALRTGLEAVGIKGPEITPFGGEKASGLGPREQGKAAREFYTSMRTVLISPSG